MTPDAPRPEDDAADRLRAALDASAHDHPVDQHALLADLHARLARQGGALPPAGLRPSRRSWTVPALVAAAAVVLVALAATGLTSLWRGQAPPPLADLGDGAAGVLHRVAEDFSCGESEFVDLARDQAGFDPDLRRLGGAAGVARAYEAPRWRLDERGDGAVLRLGNADGSLASRTDYRRTASGWEATGAWVCTGIAGPPGDGGAQWGTGDRLGRHGYEPRPLPEEAAGDPADGAAVLVDDRAVHDEAGLRRAHESLWAQPCGTELCLTRVGPDGHRTVRLPAEASPGARDVSAVMEDLGSPAATGEWVLRVVWDPADTVSGVEASGDGRTWEGVRLRGEGWGQAQAFALLVPARFDVRYALAAKPFEVSGG